ncbi:hypothetical protein LEP1GSC021_2440 [Leptospira noguchii str. 1993005606]|nr:hypothetical protein [Leptospira noguchii]EPE85202.1 hypothetical protein LEP1GSC021_2440 [Leptospira noguchii str. 1993005606]
MCVFDPSGSKSSSTVGKVIRWIESETKTPVSIQETTYKPVKMKPEKSSK